MRIAAHDDRAVRLHAIVIAIMLLTSLVLMTVGVQAQQDGALSEIIAGETQRLIESMDLSGIQRQVPQLDAARLLRDAAGGDFSIDGGSLSSAIRSTIAGQVTVLAPRMVRIIGIAVLCAALLKLRSITSHDSLARMCGMIAYLCMILPVAYDYASLLGQGRNVTEKMVGFYETVLPTMLALLTAIGGTNSAMMMQEISLTATGFMASFVQTVLFSLLGFAAAIACLNHFTPDIKLGRALKLMRTGIHWAIGICFSIFFGLLTVQGVTSSSYDSITLRAAKYAVDKFVPVVGGVFKDTADTLVGCSIIVKNAVGIVGLAGIVLIILDPCLQIVCTIAAYRLCATALEPLGDEYIAPALCDFADILTTLFILIISIGAMFFVFIAALMRVGMGFI